MTETGKKEYVGVCPSCGEGFPLSACWLEHPGDEARERGVLARLCLPDHACIPPERLAD